VWNRLPKRVKLVRSGGTAGGPPIAPTCDTAGKWQDSGLYASKTFDQYFIRNNFWNNSKAGSGSQTIWAASSRCWGVDAMHSI